MNDDTAVRLHPLSFVTEGTEVVVGRPDTGAYLVLSTDGAELLHKLEEGLSPADAARWYFESYGEEVDIADFLGSIEEFEFLRTTEEPPQEAPRAVGMQWLGRAAFSVPAWLCYLALGIVWLMLVLQHSDLRPTPAKFYFTESLVVVQLVLFLGQIPLCFLHEFFHVLAGRRLGLHTRLDISNRFSYVVFETHINGLLSVPRKLRYLPLFAGMVIDIVALFILGILGELSRTADGSLTVVGRLCIALAFTIVGRLFWQFLLYLRTDLYYVLSTALNCHDLHLASKAIFFNRIHRLTGRTHRIVDENQWTARDRKIGARYGWCISVGLIAALGFTVFLTVPLFWIYCTKIAHGLSASRLDGIFWDAVVSLSLGIFQFVLPAYLARRKRRLDAGRKPRLLAESE